MIFNNIANRQKRIWNTTVFPLI